MIDILLFIVPFVMGGACGFIIGICKRREIERSS